MTTMERTDTQVVLADVVLKPNDIYTPFQWERYNLVRWVVATLLCFVFYDLYTRGLDTLRSFPDSGSIIAILITLAVFILLALLLFPYLRFRATFRQSPQLRKAAKYTFSAEGMRFESEDSSGTCKWSGFDRIVETRKVFAFSITAASATYIPKRCLSLNDIAVLRQLIRDHFTGKWQLRRD
jgi:YcxB-like protein